MGNTYSLSPKLSQRRRHSGAYFGDKLSPLSDTTNLAAAVAWIFEHQTYCGQRCQPLSPHYAFSH